MNYSGLNPDELFSGYENAEIPSEKDPFCNPTENSSFSESYSHILPAFFFRNEMCRKKPSKLEKSNLRYFYNTTGAILAAKLFIEAALCLIFYILMFLVSYLMSSSLSMYYSVLSDATVRYAFRSVTLIASTASVFFAGCRFTALSPAGLLKKSSGIKTFDTIEFLMAGLFASALSNAVRLISPGLTGESDYSGFITDSSIMQTAIAVIYTCIVVPVTEGLVFRGLVLKNFSRASQGFGIIITSMFCALATCSFHAMLPAFITSLILCRLTVKCSSVVPGIVIHMVINLSNAVISVYGTMAFESDVFVTKIWTVIILVLGGIFAFITAVRHPLPKIRPHQRRRTIPVFLSSVLPVLLIPAYILTSVAKLFIFLYT